MNDSVSVVRPLPVGFALETGEAAVKDEMVTQLSGWVSLFTRAVLTNRRLILFPVSDGVVPLIHGVYDVRLVDIEVARQGPWWSRLVPGYSLLHPTVSLQIHNAPEVRFRARSASTWIQAIQEQTL